MFRFLCLALLCLGSHYVAGNPVIDYAYHQEVDVLLRLHTEPAAFWDTQANHQQEGVLASPTTDELVQAMRAILNDHKLTSSSVLTGVAAQAKADGTQKGSQYFDVAGNSMTDYEYNREVDALLRLHTEPATFWDAHANCQREGGVLASPTTDEMVQAMRAMLNDHKLTSSSVFAGVAAQAKADRTQKWLILGQALLEKAAGELLSAEDQCLALTGAGALADVSCARPHPYFCRKESANKCGPKGNGYEYEPLTGSCYKFHRNALRFRPALATCHAEGGLLAVINSDTESDVLRKIFRENPADVISGADNGERALVGFRKYEDGEWATILGNTLTQAGFSQWSAGEPNNHGGDEVCGSIFLDGLLNDISCTRPMAFICEITP